MSLDLAQLKSLLADEFEIDPALITAEADLFDDLEVDSIDAIDILARLRDLTGVDIPTDALKTVRTVGDVMALIESG